MKKAYTNIDELSIKLQNLSPRSWVRILDRHIYGQAEAKRAAALVMWKHLRNIRSTPLFIGPSGCGKTQIWRVLQSIYPRIIISDAGVITNDGWSGNQKYYSVLRQIYEMEIAKIWKPMPWIIVYDEFDKLIAPKYSGRGENVSLSVQAEMLRMVEGAEINIAGKDSAVNFVDTTCYTFVFLGAFESIYQAKSAVSDYGFAAGRSNVSSPSIDMDDIREYGLRAELAGRLDRVVQMDDLSEQDLYRIALDRRFGPGKRLSKSFMADVTVSSKTARKVSHEAFVSGLGVRYLYSSLSGMMDDLIYGGEMSNEVVL